MQGVRIYAMFILHEVQTVNTPAGYVAVGATITITWTYTPQENPIPGTLRVIGNTTNQIVIISSNINLSAQSYQWTINVPPSTYYFALNDGSGDKYSGTFAVVQLGPVAPNPSTTQDLFSASAQPTTHSPANTDEVVPSTPNPTTTANINQTTIVYSSDIGTYIGIAIGGIVVDSKFIPTPGNVDHMDSKFIPMPGNVLS
ncbi:941_t:CDS:2 [Racocetra fulgida]|uniref:941_t:CDS:1 n=1 Tax=Racocetra fulgida TaxID=60492 RepID=A0A9N8ZJF6_9GLOM|nr:941_t:CDS:2 [Racocetra fulgida]